MKLLKENNNTSIDKLELSNRFKAFLVSSDFREMINNFDIDNLYKYTLRSFYITDIGNLTQMLYSISINPLNYLTYVPSYFLCGIDRTINISIPNNITSIDNNAFYNCSGLTSVTIGNNVTSIGSFTFAGCTSLTNITIPDSVTSIDSDAFSECTSLKNITIPDNVTNIGSSTFKYCSNLHAITINGNIKTRVNFKHIFNLGDYFCIKLIFKSKGTKY